MDVTICSCCGKPKRPVVGMKKHQPKFAAAEFEYREKDNGFNSKDREEYEVIASTTDLAQAWEGHRYGLQALKPAFEFICVAQKPYEGKPIDSIVNTGAGALNIDAGRIGNGEDRSSGGLNSAEYNSNTGTLSLRMDQIERPTGGRWPANLILSHNEDCKRIGVKRVRGTKGEADYTPGKDATIPAGCAGGTIKTGRHYADDDGYETVDEWECTPGFKGYVPSYVIENGALFPLDEPLYLLDRLPSLIEAIRRYSTNDNGLLRHAAEFYRNAGKRSAASLDGPTYAAVYALGLSGLPSYQFGCPTCRRFCDELVHRLLTSCQDEIPSLADVLDRVHQELLLIAHNQQSPSSFHLSNSGDSHQCDTSHCTTENRTAGADRSSVSLPEIQYHNADIEQQEQTPIGDCERNDSNKNAVNGTNETHVHNECIPAIVRTLCLLSADLAYRYILPASIITRNEIYINLAPCAVARLGEQSGESVSSGGNIGNKNNTVYGKFDTAYARKGDPGFGDTGTAARYFYNVDWMYERLEDADPVIYRAKASTAERDAGLDELPTITVDDGRQKPIDNPHLRGETGRKNPHPTVKAVSLTKHLASLLLPPDCYSERRLLIPFAGVASEMIGALLAGWDEVIGIELEEKHVKVGNIRLAKWTEIAERLRTAEPDVIVKELTKKGKKPAADSGQMSLFDLDVAA